MLLERQYTPADYARMAWRRRWFIVVPFVVGVFGTLVVSSILPDVYQSEMLIQVVPQRVPDSFVESTVTLRTEDRINALSQQAMSRTELEKLIEIFNLYEDARDRLPMQDVVEFMRGSVDLEIALGGARGADAEAFYVRFSYPDAEVATRVTGRIGAIFIEQNARDRSALAEGTQEFLEAELLIARDLLEKTEARLETFRQRYAGRLPDQLSFNMQAMQNTQFQLQAHLESLARDRDRKLMLERLYSDAQTETARADATVVTPAAEESGPLDLATVVATGTAKERLARARSLLAGLELRLKPEHPDVIRTELLIDDLEDAVASEPTEALSVDLTPAQAARLERLREMRAEIESLGRRIEFKEAEDLRLREQLTDYERRIEAVPGVESGWIALSRDYETQQEAYRDLLAKSETAKVATDLERRQVGEQFRVLDLPQVPVKPTSPNRLQFSALGALGSLLLGLSLAALVELRDSTFRTENDIVELLTVPVIAHVPFVDSDGDRRSSRTRRLLASTSAVVALVVGGYVFWQLELWRYVT